MIIVKTFILPDEEAVYQSFINEYEEFIFDEHRFFSAQKMEALYVVKVKTEEEEKEDKLGEL